MNQSTGDGSFRTTGGLGARPMGASPGGASSGAGRTGGLPSSARPGRGAARPPLPGMAPHRPPREVLEVVAEPGLVVEDESATFCGAVVRADIREVVLEDRAGRRRLFPNSPAAFLFEGRPATLVPPQRAAGPAPRAPQRSASGSVHVAHAPAKVASPHRIWVEGVHDAEIVERVWGHDLRVEGVVVEPLHGADDLVAAAREFGPSPDRRLGVLVDHLVTGSKESRIAHDVRRALGPAAAHVLVLGHPYIDIWEAVRPSVVGIAAWPSVPRGIEWKRGVCDALGWGDERAGARRVLGAVSTWTDLETPLISSMEQLIDFVTVGA